MTTPPPRTPTPSYDLTTPKTRAAFAAWNACPVGCPDYSGLRETFHVAAGEAGFVLESMAHRIHLEAMEEMDALHSEALAMNSGPYFRRTTHETRALFRAALAIQDAGNDATEAWEAFEEAAARHMPYAAPETLIWIHGDALREIGECGPAIERRQSERRREYAAWEPGHELRVNERRQAHLGSGAEPDDCPRTMDGYGEACEGRR